MLSPARTDFAGIAEPVDEVRGDVAVPVPLVAQDVGEQRAVLAAPLAVDRVVGAHHAGDAGAGDPAEVREVDLVQRPLVDGDVDA